MVESARYDKVTCQIVISFNTDAGRTPISVDVGDLVHEYSAGQGLKLDGFEFSVDSTVATKDWVEDQNYLTAHQSLDGYATEDWVGKNFADAIHRHVASDVADFAESVQELTPKKVSDLKQDIPYLTEHQSLDGYATEKWVGGQGYVNEQWVRGQGFTTEMWVTSQGYIDAKALEPYQKKTVFRDWTEEA